MLVVRQLRIPNRECGIEHKTPSSLQGFSLNSGCPCVVVVQTWNSYVTMSDMGVAVPTSFSNTRKLSAIHQVPNTYIGNVSLFNQVVFPQFRQQLRPQDACSRALF